MTSEVDICNLALDMLGQAPITSLADSTKVAGLCSRTYPLSRDAVLRAYPWNFAISRADLAATNTTAEAWGPAYIYNLPADPYCLRVWRVGTELERYDYVVEGRKILSDAVAPLRILYIARITDTAQFDPQFVQALSMHIAATIAYNLTASTSLAETLRTSYRSIVGEARGIDAQEGTPYEFLAEAWVDSRL